MLSQCYKKSPNRNYLMSKKQIQTAMFLRLFTAPIFQNICNIIVFFKDYKLDSHALITNISKLACNKLIA